MVETIQFTGLSKLDDIDQDKVKSIVEKYNDKFDKVFGNLISMSVHLKQHEKSGHASNYSMLVKVNAPKKIFEAEKTDFDLVRLVRKTFTALENEIKHSFDSKGFK